MHVKGLAHGWPSVHGNSDEKNYNYCWFLVTSPLSTPVSHQYVKINETGHPICLMLNYRQLRFFRVVASFSLLSNPRDRK